MTIKKGKKEPAPIELKIKPDDELVSERVYSNYAEVSYSPYDFTIRFCDAPPIKDFNKLEKNDFVLLVPVVAEIVLPFGMIPGLIEALTSQYESHKTIHDEAKNGQEQKKK